MTNNERLERAKKIMKAKKDLRRNNAYNIQITRGTREDIEKACAYFESIGEFHPNESEIARYLMDEYSKRFIGDSKDYSQSFETQLARKGIRTMNDLTDQIWKYLQEKSNDLIQG